MSHRYDLQAFIKEKDVLLQWQLADCFDAELTPALSLLATPFPVELILVQD